MLNDKILGAVSIVERTLPRLHEDSREPISATHLSQLRNNLDICLSMIHDSCEDIMVLNPLMNTINLLDIIAKEPDFVETDAETKKIIIQKVNEILTNMYLFAGKYYVDNEFTYNMTKFRTLQNIVDCCINSGFYFNYDKEIENYETL